MNELDQTKRQLNSAIEELKECKNEITSIEHKNEKDETKI